jgi:hypothetical protein
MDVFSRKCGVDKGNRYVGVLETHLTNISIKNNLSNFCWYRHCKVGNFWFLGAFAKLWKATVNLRHVCLSVRSPHTTTRLPLDWILKKFDIWGFFEKSVEKIQIWLKCDANNGYFTWNPVQIFYKDIVELFLEWEMFQTKVVEIIGTVFNVFKIVPFMRYVGKYARARPVTDDNIIRHMRSACWITYNI